ncbi:UNVERIFIED_CONTAM: hypothetical protein K2H54_057255 [Gekko kuhli]
MYCHSRALPLDAFIFTSSHSLILNVYILLSSGSKRLRDWKYLKQQQHFPPFEGYSKGLFVLETVWLQGKSMWFLIVSGAPMVIRHCLENKVARSGLENTFGG